MLPVAPPVRYHGQRRHYASTTAGVLLSLFSWDAGLILTVPISSARDDLALHRSYKHRRFPPVSRKSQGFVSRPVLSPDSHHDVGPGSP